MADQLQLRKNAQASSAIFQSHNQLLLTNAQTFDTILQNSAQYGSGGDMRLFALGFSPLRSTSHLWYDSSTSARKRSPNTVIKSSMACAASPIAAMVFFCWPGGTEGNGRVDVGADVAGESE